MFYEISVLVVCVHIYQIMMWSAFLQWVAHWKYPKPHASQPFCRLFVSLRRPSGRDASLSLSDKFQLAVKEHNIFCQVFVRLLPCVEHGAKYFRCYMPFSSLEQTPEIGTITIPILSMGRWEVTDALNCLRSHRWYVVRLGLNPNLHIQSLCS